MEFSVRTDSVKVFKDLSKTVVVNIWHTYYLFFF